MRLRWSRRWRHARNTGGWWPAPGRPLHCHRWRTSPRTLSAAPYLLLVISYLLYAKANPTWCLYLLLITASTYFFARLIEAKQAYGKRIYIIVGATISLLPLGIFKYYNFLTENITYFLNSLGFQVGIPGLNWAVPLGISFFSFQAVGYLFDVYYQRIKAEHNCWDYMLFVGFSTSSGYSL